MENNPNQENTEREKELAELAEKMAAHMIVLLLEPSLLPIKLELMEQRHKRAMALIGIRWFGFATPAFIALLLFMWQDIQSVGERWHYIFFISLPVITLSMFIAYCIKFRIMTRRLQEVQNEYRRADQALEKLKESF